MILGLAVVTIIIVVYASSTEQYIHQGEFSINLPATSVQNSNETTKNESKQTVINYMSKWPPVVSHHVGATDNTTVILSQNNNEMKLKLTSHIVNALTTTRPTTHDGGKKKIIVLTTMRSGSSFIGRILHEHPDICYLFEPLQIIMQPNGVLYNYNNGNLNSFVQKLFRCAFTDALYDAEVLIGHDHYLTYRPCTTFLRYIDTLAAKCRLSDIKRIEVMCRRARYVAMKVIRVFPSQLALIKKYLKEEVQIIHLNRDPRGVISSRIVIDYGNASEKMMKPNINVYITQNFHMLIEKASSHCKRIRDTISRLALWTAIEPSSSTFYHLIRYEDFAYHPEAMTKTLYSSIGLKLHRNVLTWLRNATTSSKSGDLYGTTRNSTATAEAWRNNLPFHFVRAMQKLPDCQFVMRKLGYEFARSENMLHNRSVSLVLKL